MCNIHAHTYTHTHTHIVLNIVIYIILYQSITWRNFIINHELRVEEELYYQAWTQYGGRTLLSSMNSVWRKNFLYYQPWQVIYCFETIELFAIKTHCVIRKSAKRWQHISQYTNPPKGGSTWASVSKPCRLKGQMYRSLRSLEIPIPTTSPVKWRLHSECVQQAQ